MKFILTLMCILVLGSGMALATTHFVTPNGTGDYLTIGAAVAAANDGDTVLVGPGNYGETVTVNDRIHLIGAGWDVVFTNRFTFSVPGIIIEGFRIWSSNHGITVNAAADSTKIRRCRFVSSPQYYYAIYIRVGASVIHIDDCLFEKTGPGDIVSVSGDEIIIRNCIFAHRYSISAATYNALIGANNVLEVYNCVFLNYVRILDLTGLTPAVFMNNIAYDWAAGADLDWGNYLPGTIFDYNGATGAAPPGSNATLIPGNPFVNYDDALNFQHGISDLHLTGGTPAIDAGHPLILDLDASPSDLGVYGGPIPIIDNGIPGFPFVLDLDVDPASITIGEDINVNSTGRVGPSY
jgi:hypothetical protein